jgi:hypothetical protein
MSKICTLIAIPSEIIEGSTYDILNKRWPNAACHDGINKIFNGNDGVSDTTFIVSEEFEQLEGEPDYLGRLVVLLSPYLFAEDRIQPIHITKPIMSQLYRHPAYRLFCGNYSTFEELNADHMAVFGTEADESLTLDELRGLSRAELEAAFG